MMYSQQSQFHGGMAGTPQQSFGGSGTVTAPTSQFPTGATGFQQPLQFPSHPIPQAVHSPLGAASGAFPQTFQPFQGFGGSSQFAQGNVEMNTNSSAGQANPIPQAGPGLGFPQPGGPSGFPATSGGGSFVHTPPIPQQGAVQAVGQGTLPNMGNQFQTLPGGFGGHPAQQPHAGANAGNGAQYQQQGFLSNTLQGAPQSVQGVGGQNSNEQAWQKDKFESGNVPDGPPGSLYCK